MTVYQRGIHDMPYIFVQNVLIIVFVQYIKRRQSINCLLKKKEETRNYGENKNCSEKLCQFYPSLIFAGLFLVCVNCTHTILEPLYIYIYMSDIGAT